MQGIDDRIIWSERLLMRESWILWFVVISSISGLGVVTAVLIADHEPWYMVLLIAGIIVFVDFLVIIMMRSMKLDLAVGKNGFYYRMFPTELRAKKIAWTEIVSASFVKSPTIGYGKKFKFRYGRIYVMSGTSRNKGIEFTLQNRKRIFFSTQFPEELKTALLKTGINVS